MFTIRRCAVREAKVPRLASGARYLVCSGPETLIVRWSLATSLLLASMLWPTSAHACSCAGDGLPCDAAFRADAVFVGHVLSIESSRGGGNFRLRAQVEIAVLEAFRGLLQPQVALVAEGSNCDYPFRMGETYVVYAYRLADGQLVTSICTRTRPVAQATEDLTYLRSLATMDPARPARLAAAGATGPACG